MADILADTRIEEVPFERLRLDPENPRLLKYKLQEGELDEVGMVDALMSSFDPEPVGRSIVEFGFFATEPLIVFPHGGDLIVAEGNRRLVALKLLLDADLREQVDAGDRWDRLADELSGKPDRLERLKTIPCQEVPDRQAAAPIIGYRHIVGILKWDAFEKSAYVVQLLGENEDRTFEEVADLVGETPARVQRRLRDWLVLEQAAKSGIRTTEAQEEFGRWERAMNARGVRQYIGAVSPTTLEPSSDTAYEASDEQVAKLLSFLYGEPDGPDRVFSDTRRIDELSVALQSDDGVRILEDERDLERAFEAAGGRLDYVLKGLNKALTGLQQAAADYPEYADDANVVDAIEAIRAELERLTEGVEAAAEAAAEGSDEFELEDDEEALDFDAEFEDQADER